MPFTGFALGLSTIVKRAQARNKAMNAEQNARRNADMMRAAAQEAAAPDPSQADFDKRRKRILSGLARRNIF